MQWTTFCFRIEFLTVDDKSRVHVCNANQFLEATKTGGIDYLDIWDQGNSILRSSEYDGEINDVQVIDCCEKTAADFVKLAERLGAEQRKTLADRRAR